MENDIGETRNCNRGNRITFSGCKKRVGERKVKGQREPKKALNVPGDQ